MTDPIAARQLERAITHFIVTDEENISLYGRLLDKRMFIEPVNFDFISTAADLLAEGSLSKLNLLERLEAAGVKNPNETYTIQAAAITSSSNFEKHYRGWIEHARLKYIENADAELAEKSESTGDLIAGRMAILEAARGLGFPDGGVTMEAAIEDGIEWAEYLRSVKGKSVISTGYAEFDRNMIGLLPGTLTTLAARPSVGKTTMAAVWSLLAEKAGPVLFNTLEMTPGRLGFKVAALANGDNPQIYDRAFEAAEVEYPVIRDKIRLQNKLDIRYFEQSDPWALESAIIMMKPSLVVWDYLQLATTPARYVGRRAEFIGEIARLMQKIAKRRKVPIVLLSQLNRDGDGGGASMANLKDSSVIEEASDNVFFLERPNLGEPGADGLRVLMSLKKARSGFAGASIELMLNPKTGNFEYWNSIQAAQYAADCEL